MTSVAELMTAARCGIPLADIVGGLLAASVDAMQTSLHALHAVGYLLGTLPSAFRAEAFRRAVAAVEAIGQGDDIASLNARFAFLPLNVRCALTYFFFVFPLALMVCVIKDADGANNDILLAVSGTRWRVRMAG